MTDTENSTTELSDTQIDELVDRVDNASNRDVGMTQPPEREMSTPTAQTEAEKLIEFEHNGKPIKAPMDKVLHWAKMGYDYPQKAQQLNQRESQWENQKKDWENKWGAYRQIDEWASKNPQAWQKLRDSWQQGMQQPQQATNPNDPYAPKFQELESKLNQVSDFARQMMEREAEAQRLQQDTRLDEEIKGTREKFKGFPFDELNDEGKSYETLVLEHCQKSGIPSFRAGFLDLFHDQLKSQQEALAKTSVAQSIQQKTKMGFLGESQNPKKGFSAAPKNIKQSSYEDLAREAMEELRRDSRVS